MCDSHREPGADHLVDYTRGEITDGGRRCVAIIDISGNRPPSTLRAPSTPVGPAAAVGFGRTIRAVVPSPFVRRRLRSLISSRDLGGLEVPAGLMASARCSRSWAPPTGSKRLPRRWPR